MIDWRILESIPFFRGCSEEQLRGLARYCSRRFYRKWEPIHEAGSPSEKVFIILKGQVLIQIEEAPRREPAYLDVVLFAGELFGFGEIMLKHYYTSAAAMTECALLEIGKEDFLQHFMSVPRLRNWVLTSMSELLRILINKITTGGRNELALYLYKLGQESGKVINGKIYIQKKVRQPELAAALNLSREHVTRLFAKLRTEKVVQFNRGFPIIDKAWLDRVVKDKDLAASIRYRIASL